MIPARTALLAVLLFLAACAPLDTRVPAGFDLTGEWLLDESASDAPLDLDAIRSREDRNVVRGRQTNAAASAAFVVQDFPVLGAKRLSIEQSADSLGIRYDDGIYRDISWGLRERDFWTVRAGWEEGALVVYSSRGEVKGVETLRLGSGGRRLDVEVRVDTAAEDVRGVRVFRRGEPRR